MRNNEEKKTESGGKKTMSDDKKISTTHKRKTDSFSLYEEDEEEITRFKKQDFNDEQVKLTNSNIRNEKVIKDNNETKTMLTIDATTNKFFNENLPLSVYAARKGEREEMQDKHISIDNFYINFGDLLEFNTQEAYLELCLEFIIKQKFQQLQTICFLCFI